MPHQLGNVARNAGGTELASSFMEPLGVSQQCLEQGSVILDLIHGSGVDCSETLLQDTMNIKVLICNFLAVVRYLEN